MTYALAGALQEAVFGKLSAEASVTDVVGANIFETAPSGAMPGLFVALGAETVRDASDQTGAGAVHDFVVTVASDDVGFASAKDLAGRVCDSLLSGGLTLERGTAVNLAFLRARARRTRNGAGRRIDMTFRARLCDGSA